MKAQRLPVVVLILLASSVAYTQNKKIISGAYTREHDIMTVEGEVNAIDSLHLSFTSTGKLHFYFAIFFDYGHTCGLEGEATPVGNDFEYVEKMEDNSLCRLRIRYDEAEVTLEDTDGACRTTYCGMRGLIDGAVFYRVLEKGK